MLTCQCSNAVVCDEDAPRQRNHANVSATGSNQRADAIVDVDATTELESVHPLGRREQDGEPGGRHFFTVPFCHLHA